MDWSVRARSRISRLPKALRPVALFARNIQQFARMSPHHIADGITTVHNTGFMENPEFARCYARAIEAGKWDYDIPYRVHQVLWGARLAERVEGDFVELGTGRGFMMSAVLESGLTRPVHMFDTFIPNRMDEEGRQIGEASPHYAISLEDVRCNFSEWPNAILHPGDLLETLPKAEIASVAFLHVDMNHPDPEIFGIRALWPKMPTGAVMILDDYSYAGFERQFAAINQLSGELGFDILSTPTGQGIVVK